MKSTTKHRRRRRGGTAKWAFGLTLVAAFLLFGTAHSQNWAKLGLNLEGERSGDQFGEVVRLSADGNTMAIAVPAIGSFIASEKVGYTGSVKVVSWNGKAWIQKGEIISGVAPDDGFGLALDISADGNTIVVGAPYYDNQAGIDVGMARVFEFNGNQWQAVGHAFEGTVPEQRLGASVAMSKNGTRIAVGAPAGDYCCEGNGHVVVYDRTSLRQLVLNRVQNNYKTSPQNQVLWSQVGDILHGLGDKDKFGSYIDLNSAGNVLAVGSPGNSYINHQAGMINVFVLDANEWSQIGYSIYGEQAGDNAGSTFDLSDDGEILAVGTPCHSGMYYNGGKVVIYRFNSINWEIIGDALYGRSPFDYFGYSVSLNQNGRLLLVGAPFLHPQGFEPEPSNETPNELAYPNIDDYKAYAYVQAFKWQVPIMSNSVTNKKSLGTIPVYDDGYWATEGDALHGNTRIDYFGNSVAVASNRSVVAIGASQAKFVEHPADGYVSVYQILKSYGTQEELVQIDSDREDELTGNTLSNDLMKTIYPNPTKGFITLELNGFEEDVCINVYHISGNLMWQRKVSFMQKADFVIPGRVGMYYVEVLTASGKRQLMRVIKE